MHKNILHIISSTQWRGGEQQVHYLLNADYKTITTFLFCPENAAILKKYNKQPNSIFTYKKRFGADIIAAFQLKKICKLHKIDILHIHDSHGLNTFLLATLLGLELPVIFHRHVNFPIHSKWKYNNKHLQKIIAVSETVKENIASFIDVSKIEVINPCIDILKYSSIKNPILRTELNIPASHKIIGIVAAIEQEKNIEAFLQIANYFENKSDYQFVVIGDGSLLETLKVKYNKPTIHFVGFRNDVEKLLPDVDVFLFTSANEGFGMVLLEAMASEVPVITTNFKASTEIILSEKNGYIVNNQTEMIEKLDILLTNENLRKTIIENARNFVQHYDVKMMIDKIEAVYQQL
jgi:glycosyltransferase involved in cell wall biosynthesis